MRVGVVKIRRIFFWFFGLLLFGFPVRVRAQEKPPETIVNLDVVYGFNNNIKSNEAVPVRVKVNCLSGSVSGKIQIEIPVQADGNLNASIWMSDMDGRNNKEQCYIWERDISLEEGDRADEVFYLELPMYESYINVAVISEDKVLETKQAHCDYTENDARLLVGIISEQKAEIVQLNGMQISNDTYYQDEVFLKAIPLDIEAIYENPLAFEQLDLFIVDEGTQFSKTQNMAIEAWEKNGGLYLERKEESLVDVIARCQTGEYAEQFQALLSAAGNVSYYSEDFDEIPLKEKISIGRYIFIIVLYLLVIGPGLYWLLRGKKEPYWLLGSVCLISFLFMFLIYFTGRSINMSNPAICHQTIYEQKGTYLREYADFSVQAYQMQNFVLQFDKEYQILPKGIGMDGTQSVDAQMAETITFEHTEQKNEVLLQNISAYRKKCFSMERYQKLSEEEQITFQMSGTGDFLQISWNNPTKYYLKDAVVVLENRIALVGEIKPFSHGSMEEAKLNSYSRNGMSFLLNDLLDFSEYTFSEYEIKNLTNVIWEKIYRTEGEIPFVIGILENPTNAFADNRGFEVYGTSLMKIDVEIDWRNEQIIWCPNLETYGMVYKGEYESDTNVLHSKEVIVDYPTSQMGVLESLEFFYPDYSRPEESVLFDGKIYLFNWKTGKFTEWMFWNQHRYNSSLEQYISDTGVLRIYYATNEWVGEFHRSCILPCIKASGKAG